MMTLIYFLVILAALNLVFLVLVSGALAWGKFRGRRVITCPETHAPAGIRVDARRAAVTGFLREPTVRLRECSRWPERQDCDQGCLEQVEEDPHGTLVSTILSRWYRGKTCIHCGRDVGDIAHLARKPALERGDGTTFEWGEIASEHVPEVLETHAPVCFACHVTETFRRRYPGLVVDRSSRGQGSN